MIKSKLLRFFCYPFSLPLTCIYFHSLWGNFSNLLASWLLSIYQVPLTPLADGSARKHFLSPKPKSFEAEDLMKNLISPTSPFYCCFVWFPWNLILSICSRQMLSFSLPLREWCMQLDSGNGIIAHVCVCVGVRTQVWCLCALWDSRYCWLSTLKDNMKAYC